jgi:hypothetical protein
MACNLTAGIPLSCRDNVGGVQTIYITDFSNIASITKNSGDTITSISGTGNFYEFKLFRSSSQYSEKINASLVYGTIFYTEELVCYFAKLDQTKRNIVKTLGQSPRLAIVMVDNNNNSFYLGETYGSYISAGSSVTGKALGDQAGYNLTFQALEPNPMNELSGSLSSIVSGISVETF